MANEEKCLKCGFQEASHLEEGNNACAEFKGRKPVKRIIVQDKDNECWWTSSEKFIVRGNFNFKNQRHESDFKEAIIRAFSIIIDNPIIK
jgi:hypothetical protein